MKEIIDEIEGCVNNSYNIFTSMGVTNGLAGVSLFNYYLFLSRKDEKYLDKAMYFLEESLQGLNEDYIGPDIIKDIIEISNLIMFYIQKEVLDKEDISFFYETFDPIIEEEIRKNILDKNLSAANGALKNYAYYFRKVFISSKSKTLLEEILLLLKENAIKDKNNIYWLSNIKREGKYLPEVGVGHGISGKILFLVESLNYYPEYKNEILELLYPAINSIKGCYNPKGFFSFPFEITSLDYSSSSLNLAYGDLGVSYALYKAGISLNDKSLLNFSIELIEIASKHRIGSKIIMRDANLLYGVTGIASYFRLFNNIFNADSFKNAADYWYSEVGSFKIHEGEWAGFDTFYNKFDINAQLSFLHGIIGIGIALISYQENLNLEYLSFCNYKL
ncbi:MULTISPECIES: lanthionine synthetase LanC family protein [Elizabethkingia]|uniref:Lanthionine biosynthesis cyclase lanC n=2 Tax=Elizabethkingia anophelis TaxID=1117645 RepID=A0A455ZGK8_9FLAO|nr:lanthionine synthetase LanC family protein [Elizabethkingia anophelis]AIL44436.1 hypothetical protein BD94_0661 [Elizabethkingia anophelis NUHP1]MDV3898824.1 hypothetical protein [Elizabethkingia anophelis]MDV4036823.1 hypothetical protein [Elizabethkingia anophelis]DAC75804.1 TPA_exp: lanthionine biosynthesis cyclase lanC [Elizabethkingia anophelis]